MPEPESSDRSGWLARRQGDVFLGARELVQRHAQSPDQLRALEAVVASLGPGEGRDWSEPALPALPLRVHAALTGDDEPALPVAIATALLGRGVDVLDDLADGDRPEYWQASTAAEMTLAASDLCCALPHLALAELDAPAATIVVMQQTLALGFLRASAGQRRDLALAGRPDVSAAAALECAAGKAGAFLAMVATLPAHLAGVEQCVVEALATFGQALGTATSVAEDCDDLFGPGPSRDLRAGARSFPLALYLERCAGSDRAAAVDLLDAARRDDLAQDRVRERLLATGTVRHCAVVIAWHCERATRALRVLPPREPATNELAAMVDAIPWQDGAPAAHPAISATTRSR